MIVCAKCGAFVGHVTYKINGLEQLSDVTGWCKRCHKKHAPVLYDDYYDIVGWPKENEVRYDEG